MQTKRKKMHPYIHVCLAFQYLFRLLNQGRAGPSNMSMSIMLQFTESCNISTTIAWKNSTGGRREILAVFEVKENGTCDNSNAHNYDQESENMTPDAY